MTDPLLAEIERICYLNTETGYPHQKMVKQIYELIIADRQRIIKELDDLEMIEWENHNNQSAMAFQRAQEIVKGEEKE